MRIVFASLLICSLISSLNAAVFSNPSHLINIPIYRNDVRGGELEFTSSSALTASQDVDFDVMINYAITDRIITGITLINASNIAANVHFNFAELNVFDGWGFAGGVQNMSNNPTLSSWDQYVTTQDINFSPYMVSSLKVGMFNYNKWRFTNCKFKIISHKIN